MSGEQALRKFSDVENKSLKIAQEKELLAAELKNEREAHRSELEHLRGSGDFLRKSVTSMQTQINQATSESFELKFNYDEMFRNLDGFKRELRRISENLSLKSKEKNKFKNLHEESATKESELQKQSLAMQMEILELTAACKQLQSENNFLRSQTSSTGDILGHTLESLNGYLKARSEAGSLVQETQAANAQLNGINQKLETKVRVLEEELASTRSLLQTSNQAFQETRHAVENQISSIRAYSQLYDAVDSSLYSILQESQKAISEATKSVSPTYIHELQKQIAGLTQDLQASNMEILTLQQQLENTKQASRGRPADPSPKNRSRSKHARIPTTNVQVPIPPRLPDQSTGISISNIGQLSALNPSNTALLASLKHKSDRDKKVGKKFCNHCGSLVKPRDKYLECEGCEAVFHPKCLSSHAKPIGDGAFHCEECI